MHCKSNVGACTHQSMRAKLLTSSSGQPEAWAQCHEAKARCPAEFCAFLRGRGVFLYMFAPGQECLLRGRMCFCFLSL